MSVKLVKGSGPAGTADALGLSHTANGGGALDLIG